MSNGGTSLVVIGCEAEGYPAPGQFSPAAVEVEFGRVEGDHAEACVRVRLGDQALGGWQTFYGLGLLTFADDLARIHARMSGSARLTDWDGEVVLCLTVIDHSRGRVAIGGQLLAAVFWTEATSEDCLLAPRPFGTAGGIRVAFEGLVTDQSYLPGVIAGLRCFLGESGISAYNPME